MATNSLFRSFLSLYLGMTFLAIGLASTLLFTYKTTEPQTLLIRALIALAVFIFVGVFGALRFAFRLKQLASMAAQETLDWKSSQTLWAELKQTLQDGSFVRSISPSNVTSRTPTIDSWSALQNEINSVVSTVSSSQSSSDENSIESLVGSIQDLNKGNETIIGEVKRSTDQMKEIVTVISEIGAKTKVINDIVFQTKLLSFNASVEAARAGEQGKGFAVVAEEVGNLAHMSGQAAREITTMLDESIRKVNSISSETQKSLSGLVEANEAQIKRSLRQAQESIHNWKSWKEHSQQHSDEIKKLEASTRNFNENLLKMSSEQSATQTHSSSIVLQNVLELVQRHDAQLTNRQKTFETLKSYLSSRDEAHYRELDSWTPAPLKTEAIHTETNVVKLSTHSPKKTKIASERSGGNSLKSKAKMHTQKATQEMKKNKSITTKVNHATGSASFGVSNGHSAAKELPVGLPKQDDPRFQDI